MTVLAGLEDFLDTVIGTSISQLLPTSVVPLCLSTLYIHVTKCKIPHSLSNQFNLRFQI